MGNFAKNVIQYGGFWILNVHPKQPLQDSEFSISPETENFQFSDDRIPDRIKSMNYLDADS